MSLEKLAWHEIGLDSEDFDSSELPLHELSTRKSQVLELLTSGFNTKMIANQLSLSDETVKTHIKQIKDQLHCCSSHELIKKCYQLRKKSG
ncbi:response regulator transcription factor [Cysteiniphilum litorale]|uniref:response regulator transcription factor n=1 Tax=Cysteiniphilum litorale TaxID=2056700 RepID=UPI003F8842CC